MARSRKKSHRAPMASGEVTTRKSRPGDLGEPRKGIFAGEALRAICRQVGVTEKELREISVKSVRHNQALAKQFDERIAARERLTREALEILRVERSLLGTETAFAPLHTLGWPAPPQAASIRLDSTDSVRHLVVSAKGTGGDGSAITTESSTRHAAYLWTFVPMVTGYYFFSVPFLAAGPYYVVADDGPCDDKYARIWCGYGVSVSVAPSSPGYIGGVPPTGGYFFDKTETNRAIYEDLIDGKMLHLGVTPYSYFPFRANEPVSVVLSFGAGASACGAGSSASIDLQLYAPYLDVSWIEGSL